MNIHATVDQQQYLSTAPLSKLAQERIQLEEELQGHAHYNGPLAKKCRRLRHVVNEIMRREVERAKIRQTHTGEGR